MDDKELGKVLQLLLLVGSLVLVLIQPFFLLFANSKIYAEIGQSLKNKQFKEVLNLHIWGLPVVAAICASLPFVIVSSLQIILLASKESIPKIYGVSSFLIYLGLQVVVIIYFMKTVWLEKKPPWYCDNSACGKFLHFNESWVCGFCNFVNYHTLYYSLFNKCEQCRTPPKVYECPHCAHPNFFGIDKDMRHCAKAWKQNDGASPTNGEDPHAKEVMRIKREKELIQLDTELTAELVKHHRKKQELKSETQEPPPQKPMSQKLEEDFDRFSDHNMGVKITATAKREEGRRKYANYPDLLEKHEETIAAWERNNIQ